MASREVFVRLLNEGIDVWRPTLGEAMTGSTVRLCTTPGYDADDEQWEFPPGALVECEERAFSGGESRLVAVREVDA